MIKYVIIDPASPEFNRGSFCYLPYILFNTLFDLAVMKEDFTVAQIDELPEAENYLVALWSYPQIEACLTLHRFLPRGRVKFFGYYPLIDHLGLPKYEVTEEQIEKGCLRYPHKYPYFKHLLLSDCDMHLTKYEGKVVPMFTSYGCPRGCAFCPSTVNTGRRRLVFEEDKVKNMLHHAHYMGYRNIHFTDEDWFFDVDRAYNLADFIVRHQYKFQLIALSEVKSLLKFINKHGWEILRDAGFKLIEVGLETADPKLSRKMGKAPIKNCIELAEKCKNRLNLFWLNLTFFPGETITTLNETGEFMGKYGFKYDEVQGRIRTNGTKGGLGQFFQPYHGTKNYHKLKEEGVFLTRRPVRLVPSYIPDTFFDCKVRVRRNLTNDEMKWLDLYNLHERYFDVLHQNNILNLIDNAHINQVLHDVMPIVDAADMAIFLAVMAKLGAIEEG